MKKNKLRKYKQHKRNIEQIVDVLEGLPGNAGIFSRIPDLTTNEMRELLFQIARILGYRQARPRLVKETMEETKAEA